MWEALIAPLTGLISKVLPDTAAKDAAVAQLKMLAASGALQEELTQLAAVTSAQTDINKVEAASTSMFVAGWRPFVGWVCGVGLGISVVINPLLTWAATLSGYPIALPKLDDPMLQSTLAGMLGLGYGLRTLEKWKGVQGSH
jgi:hypothetical protein